MVKVAILGTVGVPASYGGFETLVENLVRYHDMGRLESSVTVYCSGKNYASREPTYLSAQLKYLPINANGAQSIPYDIWSLLSAVWHRNDVLLLLGVSGAIVLPLVRLFSSVRIITNIDGIEWRRKKWQGLARGFLRFSEKMAVRFSHEVIADNAGIAEHVARSYGRDCHVIAYGGDHAVAVPARPYDGPALPPQYALALCRIEPENNVAMILEAFAAKPDMPLVFVGNWNNSEFGRELRLRCAQVPHLQLLDPIYDLGILRTLRGNATLYVHGHSAGGTNPSLVEMMHFGVPILAYDCIFNRCTTEEKARFFKDTAALRDSLDSLDAGEAARIGEDMRRIAEARYTWDAVGRAYFDILLGEQPALGAASTRPAGVSG
jgi:glycosyltransferase involved in cell wall biosynthesis